MRRSLLFLVLALSVSVAACGGNGDDDDAASSPDEPAVTTTTLDPDTPVTSPPLDPDEPVDPGGPTPIEATNDAVDPLPTAFDPAEARATDEGVAIRFYGGVEPCFVLDHFEVVETAETVTVTLFVGAPPAAASTTCIEIAVLYEVQVPLQAPLGERALTSGAVF